MVPFQLAVVMPLCSSPAAWMPLMSTPHMPSCPTTSYSGDLRTKNSSVALAMEREIGHARDWEREKWDALNP